MPSFTDEGRAVDIVELDFRKAFDTASQKVLRDKLLICGVDGQTVRWTENWLNGQAQWVVTNGTKSTRGPVTGGTHHRLMLGAILVNTITKDLDDGCSVPSQNWEEQLTCQRSCCHLEGPWQLEKWADRRNLRKFNKEKCKDLHLVRNNPRHPAGDQLGRRGPEVPVGYPVEQDTACLCSKWLPAGGGRSPFLSAQHW